MKTLNKALSEIEINDEINDEVDIKRITLNKTLSRIDEIIYNKNENFYDIIDILENVRQYMEEHYYYKINNEVDRKMYFLILRHLNYLIQESKHSITFKFLYHLQTLRKLILMLYKEVSLNFEKGGKSIDFDKDPNEIINKLVDLE